MNRVIMFWSSTITIFLNVEAIMLAMAYACSRIIDSLIAFASPLQLMTLEAFWNLNHHRSLVVVVPKSQI